MVWKWIILFFRKWESG